MIHAEDCNQCVLLRQGSPDHFSIYICSNGRKHFTCFAHEGWYVRCHIPSTTPVVDHGGASFQYLSRYRFYENDDSFYREVLTEAVQKGIVGKDIVDAVLGGAYHS